MNTLPLPLWAEILVAALLVTGAAFALLGSWALVKLGDFFKRRHGPSKAGTLGVGCVLAASALAFAVAGHGSFHELLVVAFLALTAPVSAQLLVQAALKHRPALPAPPALESSPTNAQTSAQTSAQPP